MADKTAISKPNEAEMNWMMMFKSSGTIDKKAKMDAAIPEIGCVKCSSIVLGKGRIL